MDTNKIMASKQIIPLPQKPKTKLEKKIIECIPWLSNNNKKSPNKKDINSIQKINKNLHHKLDLLPVSNFLTAGSSFDHNNDNNLTEEGIFREIQHAFLRFFTAILGQYRGYFVQNNQTKLYDFNSELFLEENSGINILYGYIYCYSILDDYYYI